ncbi:chemotaxis protein CheC [Anoxybacillus voinovskiensis]|uniref:Chemotaxis protein CheC n=1 Tax=Anoxybacteroides voinovskiense TaxID=230470 RepID=A0A840DR54_9BACL|nr:chemotaxis protein CheC [Anoxybacillus voinovskiensis]MBB4072677.1 chemotaxis protein CheC [Anoxybacillus voinovskiensis]GGJ56122.1 CheY-P phosphatase CheC [Anoxybacillus voinovskiensis]
MATIRDLNADHIDILKEIGNIGAGNAATALSQLLNKKIEMNVPNVQIVSFDEMMDLVGGAEQVVAAVFLRIEGEAPGSMFFVLSLPQAERFVKQMTGDALFSLASPHPSELGISALQELGNILAGSYLSALADFTKLTLYPSVPALTVDMIGAILQYGLLELSRVGDYAIVIDTAVHEEQQPEDSINGHFFLLPDPDSFVPIFRSLGVSYE